MAVRRKPHTVEEFINAGSTVPGHPGSDTADSVAPEPALLSKPEAKSIAVTLRVPRDLLAELDAAAKLCRPRRSRNTWILEAIIARLELISKAD